MYIAFKHLHFFCVVLSGLGFFLRGLLMLRDSAWLQVRWLRIVPHINDTLLLTAAIVLAVMSEQYPLVEPWLTAKVFGLIAYIMLGSLALKAGRSKRLRVTSWLLALLTFGYIVGVGMTRDAMWFFTTFSA
ncbi:MAG: SirB2 family protein [Sterolibacterium sp.]|nr:SirB2 family protein [Sterolibacterium sp.]